MTTECYAMVRGSAIRVTGLGRHGEVPSPIQYAVSKSVAKVEIDEVTESGSDELLRNAEDEARLRFISPEKAIRYTASIDFIRVDPGVLSIVAGVPLVYNAGGDVVGFDLNTRIPAQAFGLEVWSKLAGARCPTTGLRQWGYTLFPFLRGGYLSGFVFENGLVSFNLRKAQTRRSSRWGVGPYDLEGPFRRLVAPVSRNTMFHTTLTTAPPPTQVDGVVQATDVIDGGSASMTTSDVVDGETVTTSLWIVEGGRAV